jgi:hypothetical protein
VQAVKAAAAKALHSARHVLLHRAGAALHAAAAEAWAAGEGGPGGDEAGTEVAGRAGGGGAGGHEGVGGVGDGGGQGRVWAAVLRLEGEFRGEAGRIVAGLGGAVALGGVERG